MKHFKSSDMAERLFKGADELFNARVKMRKDADMLQDAYEDATEFGPALYANPLVKEARDMIHDLDKAIGAVARQMEHLARQIKKQKKS